MKKNALKIIALLAIIVCAACAGYLGYNSYSTQKQKEQEKKMAEDVVDQNAEKIDIDDILNMDFTGERDGVTSPIPDDVFNEDSDKKVDFDKLKSYNEELIAWIYVSGTEINYPVARHEGDDQTYYLNYDMYGNPSYSGCIYMEKYNKADFSDNNTILYGHNMKNGTMFKGLHKFEDQDFFDENQYIYIYLPDRTLVYEIFAAYTSDDTYILGAYDFTDKKIYQEYLDNVMNPSYMGAFVRDGVNLSTDDKIITLSTCVGGDAYSRYLVQGVLKYDKTVK